MVRYQQETRRNCAENAKSKIEKLFPGKQSRMSKLKVKIKTIKLMYCTKTIEDFIK